MPVYVALTVESTVRLIEYPNFALAEQEVADFNAFVEFSRDHMHAEIITPEQRAEPLIDTTLSAEPYHAALLTRGWRREGGRYTSPDGGEPLGLYAAVEQAGLLHLLDTDEDLLNDTGVDDDDSVGSDYEHLDDGE